MRPLTTNFFAPLFAVVAIGCGGSGNAYDHELDEDTLALDKAGKADSVVRPLGSYEDDSASAGEFTLLTLRADKTFHRETMVTCVKAPCNPVADDGKYEYRKSGSYRYIRFEQTGGQLLDTYAYTLAGSQLTLRRSGQAKAFVMSLAATCVPKTCGQTDCGPIDDGCGGKQDCSATCLPVADCKGDFTPAEMQTAYNNGSWLSFTLKRFTRNCNETGGVKTCQPWAVTTWVADPGLQNQEPIVGVKRTRFDSSLSIPHLLWSSSNWTSLDRGLSTFSQVADGTLLLLNFWVLDFVTVCDAFCAPGGEGISTFCCESHVEEQEGDWAILQGHVSESCLVLHDAVVQSNVVTFSSDTKSYTETVDYATN